MRSKKPLSRTIDEFVLDHTDDLVRRLNVAPVEASQLLCELGTSLCHRLCPQEPDSQAELSFPRLQVVEHLSEGVVVADLTGQLLDWNPAALRIHGFASVAEVRRNLTTFTQQFELSETGGTPLEPSQWPLAILLRGGKVENWELVCRRLDNDQIRYIRYNGSLIPDEFGDPQFAILMLTDLTEQYQAYRSQLKLSKLLHSLSDVTQDALFVKDPGGRYTWLNQATARYIGLPLEEILGKDDSNFFRPDEVAVLMARQQEVLTSGAPQTTEETLTSLGQTRTFLATKAPYVDESGQKAGIIGISRDITAQRLAETQLAESEALLKAIIDNAQAVIWVKSLDGRFRIVNQFGCLCWKLHSDEILGKTSYDLFPLSLAEEHARHEAQVMSTGQTLEVQETLQIDDETKNFYSIKFPLLSPVGEIQALAAICTDITASKNLEQQFWQAQKMEAVGRLAGGVAHDFNNQLTIILGNCDLVLTSMDHSNPDRELLQEVYRAGERTARLTRQLMAFSRLSVTTPMTVDLNGLLNQTVEALETRFKRHIQCKVEPGEGLGMIEADPSQLEQLLMNLISNAFDAMPEGGELTLRTSRRQLDSPFAGLSPGPFAVLSVSDTGSGIRPEIRDRIFEPFFTTKELGQGTGLGLAVAQGILEQLGGAIQLEMQDTGGATFVCWFPVVDKARSTARPSNETSLLGSETVLVIEDEAGVRRVARLALESRGYNVLEASGGAEALELLDRYQGPLDCILSDVAMPGMSGPQVVEIIRRTRPHLPIIFMSGYTDGNLTSKEQLDVCEGFVQKPFSPLALARTVRQVLDG